MAFDPPWFKKPDVFGARAFNAGSTLVLTLLPAGHPPGCYVLTTTQFVTTAGTGGTLGYTIGWDQPVFGAATLSVGNANLNATGLASTTQRAVESTGLAALTATFTPASVTGSPLVHINCSATFFAPPVPA